VGHQDIEARQKQSDMNPWLAIELVTIKPTHTIPADVTRWAADTTNTCCLHAIGTGADFRLQCQGGRPSQPPIQDGLSIHQPWAITSSKAFKGGPSPTLAAARPSRMYYPPPMMRTVSLVVVLTLACSTERVALGDDVTDNVRVSSTRGGYLSSALAGEPTWADVLAAGDGLGLSTAPDPSSLLSAMSIVDDERSLSGTGLSVLSYNVALLDVALLGVFEGFRRTPTLEQRRRVLPGLVIERDADVVMLQEVWRDQDVERFTTAGTAAGYAVYVQDRSQYNDGLAVMIKKEIINGNVDINATVFATQDNTEFFPGPGIKRGFLSVHIIHPQIGSMYIYNTHMQAFPDQWKNRLQQARQMGIAIRDEAGEDLAIVGGDFNAGPYYRDAVWKLPEGKEQGSWHQNALSYPALLTYGGLDDLLIMGRAGDDALFDVSLGNTVVNDPTTALETPGASATFCTDTPPVIFSATDCNELYFQQYAATEYPARLDHLFVHDPAGRVRVTQSGLTFTEKRRFDDVEIEPSDHYSVFARLVVGQ
jgi:exonuclease III